MTPTASLALFVCALFVAAPAAHAKEAPAVTLDAAFRPAEQAEQLIELKDRKWVQGLKRVAVTQFAVEFVTNDAQTARTSSFGGGGASITARWALAGVAEPDFQAVTEAFYARFVQDLAASGLEVVPVAEVMAAPTWKKFAADGTAYPQRTDVSVTTAPPGMVRYGLAKADPGARAQNERGGSGLLGVISAVQGIGAVASTLASQGDSAQLQKELGEAALLEVKLLVHFVDLVDDNRGFFGRMAGSASVTGTAYPSIRQGGVFVHRNGAVLNMALKAPLRLDGTVFTSVKDQTAQADGERWRAVVGSGLGTAGQLVVERLRAAR
jgi:hypothetical protein